MNETRKGPGGAKLPKSYERWTAEYPAVAQAYTKLGEAVHRAGPLDERTRALLKLAISVGAKLEGGVHSHVRKALAAGATPEEIRQTAILALPTIGLPSMMASLSWVNDILDGSEGGKR
jgi:AhpD family alkylhydroperoxidase